MAHLFKHDRPIQEEVSMLSMKEKFTMGDIWQGKEHTTPELERLLRPMVS